MAQLDDNAYYIRRIAEEIERGDQAPHAVVAAVHYELALRYSIRRSHMGEGKPRFTLVYDASEQLAA